MLISRYILSPLLSVLLLVSTVDTAFYLHYCRGEVKKIGFDAPEMCDKHNNKGVCSKGDELPPCHQKAEKEPCCENLLIASEGLSLAKTSPQLAEKFQELEVDITAVLFTVRDIISPARFLTVVKAHAPPLLHTFNRCIEFCVFRI